MCGPEKTDKQTDPLTTKIDSDLKKDTLWNALSRLHTKNDQYFTIHYNGNQFQSIGE